MSIKIIKLEPTDFLDCVTETQKKMALQMFHEGVRCFWKTIYRETEHDIFHIEDQMDLNSPRRWAKAKFGLTKEEYKIAIAWVALANYSRIETFDHNDPERIMSYINVSYTLLNDLSFSEYSYPGDKVSHEIADELEGIAPQYSAWLRHAAATWIEAMEERVRAQDIMLEMSKRAFNGEPY